MITSTLGEIERNPLKFIGDFIWLQNEKKKERKSQTINLRINLQKHRLSRQKP